MDSYLSSIKKLFDYYKLIGEKTFVQLTDEDLFWKPNDHSLSIAEIVKHLSGNMLSRWTNFKTEDGEKSWRNRDGEFELTFTTREEILEHWEKGWQCLFTAIGSTQTFELEDVIYIRNMGHTILEAFNRQLAHYSMHVGQIVYIGKNLKGSEWESLSVPVGKSKEYNAQKFEQAKRLKHFTDDL